MSRVRADLFSSLDGFTAAPEAGSDNPMGDDWEALTAAYAATRTFREKVFGDTTGAGTTGLDDAYASAFFTGVGAEIMGAAMFGLHANPDDPDWKGWWGEEPPFGCPVYVLTHSAPRPSITMAGGTTFHFRTGSIEDVLGEATAAANGLDVRIGGGIRTAHEFLRADLVDDLHIALAPIVLGRGNLMWEGLRGYELTRAVTSEVSESGVVHVTFTR
ncbi:dihydrofolate reductase family protein [Microbacterium sp. P05]|uniref:dihydrofolate reductase family protein n=1 Tax=Microbacterium sp. P05 TaxID=3366948 RepID=UPI003744C316